MTGEDFLFLAQQSGNGLVYWLDQPATDCIYWFNEAVKLYKKLNPSNE
jgi:hypothetical protein